MHAYAELTPDLALDALDSAGFPASGELLALNSYENRVFRMGLDDGGRVVAKFYRPKRWSDAQILEEHAFTQELADADLPVVAPFIRDGTTLFEHAGFHFAVYPVQGGRPPDFEQDDTLVRMGRLLGRIHAVGRRATFKFRPALDIASFGEASRDTLAGWLPPDLEPAWDSVVAHALEQVRHCYTRAGRIATLRLHGDCHAGNVLWTDDGPHFVDFDDCRTGPAIQDLWMLLSGEREQQQEQMLAVLEGYEDFMEFDPAELHLVEALRTLRLLHYAAWLARRWDDPAFPAAFPWFNTPHDWQARILQLREQIALMDEPPLAV